ncbi:MAG: diguanylate cyclase domain-containing protein [Lachnospiraceae bacterium]
MDMNSNESKEKHILIVDDNTTNLKGAADVLEGHYRVSMAKSGEQALNFLNRVKPDLILLDIIMPQMDGYETLQRIKDNPETMDIPVVFLTADNDSESEIRGLKMGAMDYIRKPFEPEVVLSRIEKILRIEELRQNLTISARKDVLTNLWNRGYMEEQVDRVSQSDRTEGVFMLLDMDNFKSINDNFGHIMGDAVLVQFAKTLQSVTREGDVICRFGGDEFAVFLRGHYQKEEIIDIANAIIDGAEEKLNVIRQEGHEVSVSIGIAMMPQDSDRFMDLYSKADKALYFVKQNGKKGVHFYQDNEKYSFHNVARTEFDLGEFKKYVEERTFERGAYQVECEYFRNIYQFIKRNINRTKQKVQITLLTMQDGDMTDDVLEQEMDNIAKAITYTLRRGDVAARFSRNQFVVILMDTDLTNGINVIKRVIQSYRKISGREDVEIDYDMDNMVVE